MGFLISIYLLILAFWSFIVYLIYWLFKKLGFRRAGTIISITLGVALSLSFLSIIFEDQLFSKQDAKKLLRKHDIHLQDDFEVLKNESSWGIGDSYHTFSLHISEDDERLIGAAIRSSVNFQNNTILPPLVSVVTERYIGGRLTQNYESSNELVRELFEPNGLGYAPTYQIIKISKADNQLVFEDIAE